MAQLTRHSEHARKLPPGRPIPAGGYTSFDEMPVRTPPAVSRRVFLQRAALAAGAAVSPQVVSQAVLGAGGTVAPSNRIAVGFIGTGRQCCHANIPGFLQETDAQAVAVCDVDSWRMTTAQRQIEEFYARQRRSGSFRGCSAWRDWRELLARPDIDAVMISTPDHWHVLQAMAALSAGKDVACEKPLTRSIAEGRALADLVRKSGRIFRTDSEFRSNGTYHRAAQLIRNGRIGTVKRIHVMTPKDPTLPAQPAMPVPEELDYDMWQGPAPERPYTLQRVHPRHDTRGRPGWICVSDYADGMLANWGAHLCDIALWAVDLERTGPISVEGTGTYPPRGNLWNVVQQFDVTFLYANDLTLRCSTDEPIIRWEGTEGWVRVKYPNEITVSDESLLRWEPGANEVRLPFKKTEKRDFLDAVQSRGPVLYDCEAGHRNNSLAHLSLIAIDLGRQLRWDPVAERFLGDAEANGRLRPISWRKPWDKHVPAAG